MFCIAAVADCWLWFSRSEVSDISSTMLSHIDETKWEEE